jgi:thioredoxin-like negative regulator of GroEL
VATNIDQLKLFNAKPVWQRLVLFIPVAAVLTGVWVAARWFIGNTMASYPANVRMARAATRLAPDDPQAHFTLGVFNKNSFLPEELDEALVRYKRATSLSPNDYRLWLELGRAYSQAGDLEGAERALRRAVELAPAYALPRWYLGNVLLRAGGKNKEAFAELQQAGEADPVLRAQVAGLAWRVYGNDTAAVVSAIGNSLAARTELIEYFARQNRLDEASRFWSSLSADEKKAQRKTGETLMIALAGAKRFQAAMNVYREIAADAAAVAGLAVGRLVNGGFEENIGKAGESLFGWQVPPGGQTKVVLDARTRQEGARSLHIIFNEVTAAQFSGVSQLVVVEPGASYRLRFWVRYDALKSASTPLVQVVDATDPARSLAASKELPNGTGEWEPVALEFNVPAHAEAVTVRIVRQGCGEAHCPIFGKVWYDIFDLQRISRAGGSEQPDAS